MSIALATDEVYVFFLNFTGQSTTNVWYGYPWGRNVELFEMKAYQQFSINLYSLIVNSRIFAGAELFS